MTTAKELIFEEEARKKLYEGIEKLVDVAIVTLGPYGRNVGLEAGGVPNITNDGYSIIKDIEFKDQYLNMGASICKEVAAKMKEKCGDGTTTAIVLLKTLVQNGLKNIASGANPISLKRGMDRALDAMLKELSNLSMQLRSDRDIRYIATASAASDKFIGDCMENAIIKIGRSGVIIIEEGKTTETKIEIAEGMQFDKGYASPHFCTDVTTMSMKMQFGKILLVGKKITSIQEILPFIQTTVAAMDPLLIIADDIEGDALSTLVFHKIRGTLKVCAVKAPGFGDHRKAMLEDIALLTGATVISEDMGMSLRKAGSTVLGSAETIVISRESTLIAGGQGDPKKIGDRVKELEAAIKITENPYDKEKLTERKAKLSGGVAVIRVGAPTEVEMRQKKQAFEDGLNAAKAALEDGIVPGAGMALFRAAKNLASLNLSGDELTGAEIVLKACEVPFRTILLNAGYESSLILEKILPKGVKFGFDIVNQQFENLTFLGVIDPTKVVKTALQLAVSSAGIVLLSEVLMGHADEEA